MVDEEVTVMILGGSDMFWHLSLREESGKGHYPDISIWCSRCKWSPFVVFLWNDSILMNLHSSNIWPWKVFFFFVFFFRTLSIRSQ